MTNAKKKSAHPTNSFAQMVGTAQLNALKPYIDQQVSMAANAIIQQIYTAMMNDRAMMQTRQLAFEQLLKRNCTWFTEEVLALEVAKVEDDAYGVVATEEPAQAGDKLRIELAAKGSKQEEFGEYSKVLIHGLLDKGPSGSVQTHQALEEALVGLKVGDEKSFVIPEEVEEGQEPENTQVKVKVMRVSRKKEAKNEQTPAS